MVVNRSHQQNPLSPHLVGNNLDNHRDGFQDENSPDGKEQKFLLNQQGNSPNSTSQGHRAHITHKDLSGIAVVPEKAQCGPNHGPAKNGELTGISVLDEIQIGGEGGMGGDISQHGQG